MKKSQVTSLVMLLLLVAVVNQAEAKRVRYRRTAKGTILNDGDTAAKITGTVTCTVIAEYIEGEDNYYENEITKSGKFKTNSKGQFSVRLVFDDNDVDPSWRQRGFSGDCTLTVDGSDITELSFGGPKDTINFGTVDIESNP